MSQKGRTPKKRTPSKGDTLGGNKIQQSINKYFSPSPLKTEPREATGNSQRIRKSLFNNTTVDRTSQETIISVVLSDDEDSDQSILPNYHRKVKTGNCMTERKENSTLSRKTFKSKAANIKTERDGNNKSAVSITVDVKPTLHDADIHNEGGTSNGVAIPKQNVLKPSNKLSLSSTKSRKRRTSQLLVKIENSSGNGASQSAGKVKCDLTTNKSTVIRIETDRLNTTKIQVTPRTNIKSENSQEISSTETTPSSLNQSDSSTVGLPNVELLREIKVEDINWSEPMEQEQNYTSGATPGPSIPKKLKSGGNKLLVKNGSGNVTSVGVGKCDLITNKGTVLRIENDNTTKIQVTPRTNIKSENSQVSSTETTPSSLNQSNSSTVGLSNVGLLREIKVEDINWSEPMEQEQNYTSDASPGPSTPKKLKSVGAGKCDLITNKRTVLRIENDNTTKIQVTPTKTIKLEKVEELSSEPVSSIQSQPGNVDSRDLQENVEYPLDIKMEDINWSELMEIEQKHSDSITPGPSTPRKELPNAPTTPQKTPGKVHSNSITPGLSTPRKQLPNAPITPQKTPGKVLTPSKPSTSPSKSPTKYSPTKLNLEATRGKLMFEHCISECKRYAKMALNLNAAPKKVADNYANLQFPEKMLLHQLLMRKWTWIRSVDMKYEKMVFNKETSLNSLRDNGFLEDMPETCELQVILDKLKLPELKQLCKLQNLDQKGTKPELASRIYKSATLQTCLQFASKSLTTIIKERAFQLLGRCVKVSAGSWRCLQTIFEASMSPLYLEGKFYTFQERIRAMEKLMDDVKYNGIKLIPFKLSETQLFKTSAQFDEYISSVILKFDMLAAKESKDNAKGVELALEARLSLMVYLNPLQLNMIQECLHNTPNCLWKYTAGSNYISVLDAGLEVLKRTKKYDLGLMDLNILLNQNIYRKHCRGHWYSEKMLIMEKYLKMDSQSLYDVLLTGLQDDLTPIGRLELSRKAESLLNKKKNGLSQSQKDTVRKLMQTPKLNHKIKEIKCTEAPNLSTGTRQTFVSYSKSDEKIYSNVEMSALSSYEEEFPEGLHDEGALLKNIILAVFWPIIYKDMDNMFVSKYQNCPLDWGTKLFFTSRRREIMKHVNYLKTGGIDRVMDQLDTVITAYSKHHSLINWSYISHDSVVSIKNVLTCLTLEKFLNLAVYLLESFRERRSGWPDLTLWNASTRTLRLVEVKSPNDELSLKQIVWLEKFIQLGIDVEECRVNPSNRGKRRANTTAVMSEASQEV